MAVSSPTCQRVPCSPNLVESVKNSSPIPSVPDVGSPSVAAGIKVLIIFITNSLTGRGKCEASYSYSPLLRHLLSGKYISTMTFSGRYKVYAVYLVCFACNELFTEPVGKRLRTSPICSSCKKIKLATSLGI